MDGGGKDDFEGQNMLKEVLAFSTSLRIYTRGLPH
jgi:hypothetical protein